MNSEVKQTAIIFDQEGEPITFAVVNGDYKHLDDIYINATSAEKRSLEDELLELIFDEQTGEMKVKFLELKDSQFKQAVQNGAEVIVIGWL